MRHFTITFVSLLAAGAASTARAQTDPQGRAYATLIPCRLADTRVIGGALQPGVARGFRVKASDLSSQGGSSTGCGVPPAAVAAMVNVVAVNPTGQGHLTAWAYGTAEPASSILNYGMVTGLSAIANGIAIAICEGSIDTCSFDFTVKAGASAAHVVVDVVGYFGPVAIDTSGPAGPPGAPSQVAGPAGSTGPPGVTGPVGLTGPAGAQGAAGAAGAQGPTGPTGPQGATGAQGPQGATGATGPPGATGAQGPLGPAPHTSAVCTSDAAWNCTSYCATVVRAFGPTTGSCTVSSNTGTCSANGCFGSQCQRTRYAVCCECRQ